MTLVVKKYGGSSLKNNNYIIKISQSIKEEFELGVSIIVVVSAQHGRTNTLIHKAHKFSKQPNLRELDALMCIGEMESASLLSIALNEINVPAISQNAYQLGISTTSDYGDSKILNINSEYLKILAKKNVVIATGFQGVEINNNMTTFGRGGSDLTALVLAQAVNADRCEIFTNVDGIHFCDPKIVPNAKFIEKISHKNLLRLSLLDNKIMHDRSISFAMQNNLEFFIAQSIPQSSKSTHVSLNCTQEKLIIGVTYKSDLILLKTSAAFNIFPEIISFFKNLNIPLTFVKSSKTNYKLFLTEIALQKNDFINCEQQFNETFSKISIETYSDLTKIDIVGCDIQNFAGTNDIINLFHKEKIFRYEYGKFGLSFLINTTALTKIMKELNDLIEKYQ